jgi:amino acid adenylation domain-containing protein
MNRAVIHSVFEQRAAEWPYHVAVVGEDIALSYRELNRRANGLAARLRGLYGVVPGSIVGLLLPPGPGLVLAMLGVAKAGGVFMPLDPDAPGNRLRGQLAKADPVALIVDSGWQDKVAALAGERALCLDLPGMEQADDPPLAVTGDDASYVVFTSGSTGAPKAILGNHKGLSHFIHWEVGELGLDQRSRVSQFAPPTFDVSLRDIFVPLLAGGTLCVPPAHAFADGARLLDWLELAGVTLIHCVPSLFRALLEQLADLPAPQARLPALRHILLAGEPLYGSDVMRWRALMGERVELLNLYGPSETTLAKAFHRIAELPADPGRMIPVGLPLPNSALLIIRDRELCDIGEIGEIHIRTPFMSKGYLNDPTLTSEMFIQNPLAPDRPDTVYRTGDLGRYRPDRSVELLGRRDGQVKVNGVRIELAEVEQALMQHPAIRLAVAVAHAGDDRQTYVTAYFTAETELSDDALRSHVAQWLPMAMHPAFFVQMESFPLNLHGKVNRRALPRPANLLYRRHAYVAPEPGDEAAMAAIWSEVLQLPKIGADHGFTELGGDSLKAIRLVARIFRTFGVEIGLPELFPSGTVRSVVAVIRGRRETGQAELAGAEGTP